MSDTTQAAAAVLAPHAANLQQALDAHAAGSSIDPNEIINLIAALLPGAIGLAQQLAAQYGSPARPMEEILSQADLNWDQMKALAAGQQAPAKA